MDLKKEFELFLERELPKAQRPDDVILDYLIEAISDVNDHDNSFDITQFMDMVTSYIPEFSTIDHDVICKWIMSLSVDVESCQSSCVDDDTCKSDDNVKLLLNTGVSTFCEPQHSVNVKTTEEAARREYLVSKYYYSAGETNGNFCPLQQKEAIEPKKLIRYRDNQVVSTKGERYHIEKAAESEEMKKTYVNLKPLRKYRFH
jgi:hypothetical protein